MRIILISPILLRMLKVCNLSVNYRNTWAIDDVSFCLEPAQITGLCGPNGAGKSSLIEGILGLIPVVKGKVSYNSRPLKQQLKKVAYVPQRNKIDWNYPITVEKVVMMGRIPTTGWFKSPSRHSQAVVTQALEKVGIEKFRKHQIGALSGGQQQRVFLARAIAQEADLLFFDEPFNNVDCRTEEIIFEVFQKLKQQQKILLVISHDLGKTMTNYDRLLLLNQQLIAQGNPQQVLNQQNIQQAYGRLVSC